MTNWADTFDTFENQYGYNAMAFSVFGPQKQSQIQKIKLNYKHKYKFKYKIKYKFDSNKIQIWRMSC